MTDRPTRNIEIEKHVEASVEDVWEAVTTPEGLRRWFPLDAKIEPRLGGSVWLSWGPGVEGEAPIHVWDPGRRFGWTEHHGDDEHGQPIKVAVDFHIEGRGGTTVIRLVQSGLSAASDWDEMYDALVDGWTYFLFSLAHYLSVHPGRPRRMAWRRFPSELDRATVWARLQSAGLVSEGAPGAPSVVEIGTAHPATVVSVRAGHHFAARLPELEESVFFVELEGRHVGFWLSTYGVEDARVEALQSALDDRVEEVLAL
jgi:uncharacterized protein YndB with AHSA1/START domain